MAWFSFIELDKAVIHVIRLTSFLWLWFQGVCPMITSCNTYHHTWDSLTLDVGYLFTAAPTKVLHWLCEQIWKTHQWPLDWKRSVFIPIPKKGNAKEFMLLKVLEKTLESPLDSKEIQPVHPKGNQSWMLIGRTDVEAETPILWPPDAKSWLIWKDPDAGKDWRQEEKGTTEDEMVECHYRLNEREFG